MDKELYNDPEISNAELVNRDTFERLMAKKRHKKVFRTISYILLAIVLCFVFVVICMALFLKIEKIEVSGNNRYTKEQIIEASGISVGQNLYAINKKTARAYITTEYPYINEVTIRRHLPSTLNFKINEEKPRYYTEICGEFFVLSESLRVLERTAECPQTEESKLVRLLMSDLKTAVVGEEIEFDDSKIVKGNIETDNNCYRLEIYNEYGKGKADPGVDQSKLLFSKSLEVTFTITGLDKE